MPKVRLSREQNKEQTRARLITVGRKHFLRHGFVKSTEEEITKEAGYTRGALHSNFVDKEGLLLEVVRDFHGKLNDHFFTIMQEQAGANLWMRLRESFCILLDNPAYSLMIEFEHASLRNKNLRSHYLAFHEENVQKTCTLLTQTMVDFNLQLSLEPADFVLAVSSFTYGLAKKKILLKLSADRTHRMLGAFFDAFVRRAPEPSKDNQRQPSRKRK